MIITTARIIALSILAALAAGPAIASIISRRTYGRLASQHYAVLVPYYLLALAIALTAFVPGLYPYVRDRLGPLDDVLDTTLWAG